MSSNKRRNPSGTQMELLAPAGTVEVFEVAVEQGADAVYIGAPALNARAQAKQFTPQEIAAMVAHGHKSGVKVYAAMNSLMKDEEIPQAIETLALFESLKIDAIIVQDLGIYYLATKYFPTLKIHASTLMAAHNSISVRQFARMGFSRVVLARELNLQEISRIGQTTSVPLEVFVHGAMCFSYSGLCLFSSYLGGKSGLRGWCVQPCRRRYTWDKSGKPAGYLFSMNDLNAIDLLPQLAKAGVVSIKIEGRMRSAQYVSSVVKAYRIMLDAPEGDTAAKEEAGRLLHNSMSRKMASGYFSGPQPEDILSPEHSGNIGHFIGKVEKSSGEKATIALKNGLNVGDRVRLHFEKTGERKAFTVKKMYSGQQAVNNASEGETVLIELPVQAAPGDSLYLVDTKERRALEGKQKSILPGRFDEKIKALNHRHKGEIIWAKVKRQMKLRDADKQRKSGPVKSRRSKTLDAGRVPWWLKIDNLMQLRQHLPDKPARLIVMLTGETFSQFKRMEKMLRSYGRTVVWSLPPLIDEADIEFFAQAINELISMGFKTWQIGHLGQLQFFNPYKSKVSVFGDYTLNALNFFSLASLSEFGLRGCQLSIETDKKNLEGILKKRLPLDVGLTIYGRPPLSMARTFAGFFQFNQAFRSPLREKFVLEKSFGKTVVLAEKPFSLLPVLSEIYSMGLGYGVIDISNMAFRKGALTALVGKIGNPSAMREKLSTFNYFGKLY
ncbi:MAG: U32 family peptidase [Proteobacteria bacterium]|nr:U32 family peptidase [Pseudomonadota bacterium]MBU1710968.1 U32 family peptidase [Pseudomonadota bacterium]